MRQAQPLFVVVVVVVAPEPALPRMPVPLLPAAPVAVGTGTHAPRPVLH